MEKAIRILGIDPGLRRMGWGIVDSDGVRLSYVASGLVQSCAKDDLASRLLQLHDGLSEIVVAHRPLEAAIEETFVNKDARATLKLGQARGVAMLVPAQRNLRVSEYAPNLIKKTITGAGHCEKSQIHAMLKVLLPRARPDSDDEADALAIAITHAHHRGARTSARLAAAGCR